MVRCKSNSRLFGIKDLVILTQTDTTVGFVSQNARRLSYIKSRDVSKPFIKVYKNLKSFLMYGNRIPHTKKNLVRRSKRTSFVVKNQAFRIAPYHLESKLLKDLEWSYSTSANESSKSFDRGFCEDKADVIIEDKEGLWENTSSTLLKINNIKTTKIR
jgi:tRNA A37 threonylcarbamoyladenosine synthetase subunit TsaC/SUA5/YrdC